ncbi:hypothetical protein CN315_23025 [Bacillus cereus]|nr:hypothetical protein CN315_23025 [Bacillus cereus]
MVAVGAYVVLDRCLRPEICRVVRLVEEEVSEVGKALKILFYVLREGTAVVVAVGAYVVLDRCLRPEICRVTRVV